VWRQAEIMALADAVVSPAVLERLVLLLRRWEPRVLLFLGGKMRAELAPQLARVIGGRQLIWVGEDFPAAPGVGECRARFEQDGLVFCHRPGGPPKNAWRRQVIAPRIFGYFRPVSEPGTARAAACFIASPQGIVLPGFGGVLDGTDISNPDLAGFFPGGRIFACAKDRFRSFTYSHLSTSLGAARGPSFEPELQHG